jgi:hypothetical protein
VPVHAEVPPTRRHVGHMRVPVPTQDLLYPAPRGAHECVCACARPGRHASCVVRGAWCVVRAQVFIDVTKVPDLNNTLTTPTGTTVGAAVSLADLLGICVEADPMSPTMTNDPATVRVCGFLWWGCGGG